MLLERPRPAQTVNLAETFSAFSTEQSAANIAGEQLHPLQQFAVHLGYAENLLRACKNSAKKETVITGLVEPGMKRRKIRGRHVAGLLKASIAQKQGAEAIAEFKAEVGEVVGDELLSRANSFLPVIEAQRRATVEAQTVRPNKRLLGLFETNARQQLPFLRTKQEDPFADDRSIVKGHVSALTEAYQAIQMGELEGTRWLGIQRGHGEMSEYLLQQVARCVAPVLEEQLSQVHSPAEAIQPYDVHLAEKRAKRRETWLPKEELEVFAELSGVKPDSKARQLLIAGVSSVVGFGLAFATDGAAGAAAGGVESSHYHFLEAMDPRLLFATWVITYATLGAGVWKNIISQIRLNRETGANTNGGFSVGETLFDIAGANAESGEKAGGIGQAVIEVGKDTIWNIVILANLAAGIISLRNAGIFSSAANLGGAGYEFTLAALINKYLRSRRDRFNDANPLPEIVPQEDVQTVFVLDHSQHDDLEDITQVSNNGIN